MHLLLWNKVSLQIPWWPSGMHWRQAVLPGWIIPTKALTPVLLPSTTPNVCMWCQPLRFCGVDEAWGHCATHIQRWRVVARCVAWNVSNVRPELLTQNHDPDLETPKACIQCEEPDYVQMIHCVQCDSHLHYSCVQIKRMLPNWLCKQCKKKKHDVIITSAL